MIYLFKVYVLVIVLVFAPMLTLFLFATITAALLKALRKAADLNLVLWQKAREPFSISPHLKSKKALSA